MLAERLAHARVGERLGTWLSRPANAARASEALADLLKGTLEVLDDKEVQEGLERVVRARIDATPAAPLVGRIVEVSVEGGHHQRLLDAVLVGLRGFLDDNRATFRQRLEQESPWWVPEPIDDRIFRKIYTAVDRFMDEVAADQDHEVRRTIDRRVAAFAERLAARPEAARQGRGAQARAARAPRGAGVAGIAVARPEGRAWSPPPTIPRSELRVRLLAGLQHLGQRLAGRTRAAAQGRRLGRTRRRLRRRALPQRGQRPDRHAPSSDGTPRPTSRKVELQVGRDLQFIRINGTIVGGLAGVMIHFVE